MSFFKSILFKNLQQGELPVVKTDNTVKVEDTSLVKIGVVLIVVAAGIALLVIIVKSAN